MLEKTATQSKDGPARFDVVDFEVSSRERRLLDPLSLTIDRGEGLVLSGRMGCGKSLLAESLAGFERPTLRYGGHTGFLVEGAPPAAPTAALVPQDWRLSALRTDKVHTLLSGHEARIGEVLEALELDVRRLRNLDVGALGAGERLRLLVARALVHESRLLVFDAPADVLDSRQRTLLVDLMEAELSTGKMILVLSRDEALWVPPAFRRMQIGHAPDTEPVAVPLMQKRKEESRAVATLPALDVADLDVEQSEHRLWLRGQPALLVDGASMFVRNGEILVLLGPSGSGKSTLLAAMAGQLPPRGGRVRVSGIDIAGGRSRPSAAAQRAVQLVSAEIARGLDPSHTVGEHLDRASPAGQRATAELWLERLGLPPHLADLSPDVLSEGEGFRVSLALALSQDPKVLLLDTPRSGALDADGGILTGVLLAERARGRSFVLGTSDPGISRSIADRIAVLDAGRVLEFGPTVLVLRQPAHPRALALLKSEAGPRHDPRSPRSGCHMAGACPRELERCRAERPQLDFVPGTTRNHRAACFNPNLDVVDA